MSDVTADARKRAGCHPEFAEGLETGFRELKIGVLLRQAPEQAGMTQEQVAERLETKKSAISRIENRAGDFRLPTLECYARAVGCTLTLDLHPPRRTAGRG